MTFIINPPPKQIVQFSNYSCWAAALESWLGVVKVKRSLGTQMELMKMYEFGADVLPFIDNAKQLWDMKAMITPDLPHAAAMEKTLRQFGCLYISIRLPSVAWWHSVVLYGVTIPKDDEPRYSIMDPADGMLKEVYKSFFLQGQTARVLVGWYSPRMRRG